MLITMIFSFNTVNAKETDDKSTYAKEIEDIRQLIKDEQSANETLENKVVKKSKQVEDLLVKVPSITLVPQDVIEQQINSRMKVILNHLTKISDEEEIMWKLLKRANKQIKAENYAVGIKNLNKALNSFNRRRDVLVEFDEDLDDFLAFLSSLQYK